MRILFRWFLSPKGLTYPLPVVQPVQPPVASNQNEKPEGLTHQPTALETTVQLAVIVSAFRPFGPFGIKSDQPHVLIIGIVFGGLDFGVEYAGSIQANTLITTKYVRRL